tara:strand:+ start:309 stop:635 length:327 start_codon:yes stop_codon:yes gene_type:complete
MKPFLLFFFVLILKSNLLYGGTWCKAVYSFNEEFHKSDFQKQISKCKNSDNFFVSISKIYKNASHILNATIANYCDLNKSIVKSRPVTNEDTFYSAVCVFRNHYLRED